MLCGEIVCRVLMEFWMFLRLLWLRFVFGFGFLIFWFFGFLVFWCFVCCVVLIVCGCDMLMC